MDLSLTNEQKELLGWADSVLSVEFTLDRFNGVEGAITEKALEKLAELGWFGLAVPEASGGSGLSIIEEVLLMMASGKCLASPSLLATTIAVHGALENQDSRLLAALTTLEKRAALAFKTDNDNELLALDAEKATHVVVFETGSLSILPITRVGKKERNSQSIDDSLSLSHHLCDRGAGQSFPSGSGTWIRAHLLLAGSLVGAGEGAMEMAVEYAKIREQFNQPIGAFQAVKHKCSNMALQLTAARSQLLYAATAFHEGLPDAEFRTLSGCSLAERAAALASYDNVQVHGGIGFTDECHAQRFAKRVTLLNAAGSVTKRYTKKLLAGVP